MRIATWNVNSLNVRLPHVLAWLESNPVDVLTLQELKLTDDKFPLQKLEDAGYQSVSNGQPTYNGVAILARDEIANPISNIPEFADEQKRVITASVNGVRIICVYCPNGAALDSDKYPYKLEWFEKLKAYVASEMQTHPNLVVLGDYNVAPRPEDTHDSAKWEGGILCSPPERQALQSLLDLGLTDTWRLFPDREERRRFTWWDYRNGGWARNAGLRIDHILASKPLADACSECKAYVGERGRKRPSDHVPVVAEFNL